jgi:hypothetical protein
MVATLAWSPDGRHIALGDIDDVSPSKGGVEIVEAATPAVVARLDTGSVPATSLVVLPEGVIVAALPRRCDRGRSRRSPRGHSARKWLRALP